MRQDICIFPIFWNIVLIIFKSSQPLYLFKSCHDHLKITLPILTTGALYFIFKLMKKNIRKNKYLFQYVVKFVILLKVSFLFLYCDLPTSMMPLYMYYYRRGSAINLHFSPVTCVGYHNSESIIITGSGKLTSTFCFWSHSLLTLSTNHHVSPFFIFNQICSL